jgi:saccharopine dehydrogenase-like protein
MWSDRPLARTAGRRDDEAVNRTVAVVGAKGHTAKFVITQLRAHGLDPVPIGRADASVDDPASLDRVLTGVAAVVNCAGPFADTAVPVIEAALRAGVHYVDIAAEQAVTMDVLARFDEPARRAGVTVAPSAAFYGGLGDLLATAAMAGWPDADDIQIAIGLDGWHPTAGTRRTVARNAGRHVVYTDGGFAPPTGSTLLWDFPTGARQLVELPTADVVTVAHHLRARRIGVHMNAEPLADLRDPATPAPTPVDDLGRSAQTFHVDAVVRRGDAERRASAWGRDIYAVSAPIAAGAVVGVLSGRYAGVRTAAQLLEPVAFLRSLEPAHLSLSLESRGSSSTAP